MLSNVAADAPIYNKLHLLQTWQQVTMVGSFELHLTSLEFFCTDGLFMVLGIPVTKDNRISFAEMLRLVVPQDKNLFTHYLLESTNEDLVQFDCCIEGSDGETKCLHVWFQHMIGDEGELVKRGSFQDITRLQEQQAELLKRNEELQIQAEISRQAEVISNTGSYQWNRTTGEIKYSDNLYRMFGLEPDEEPASIELFVRLVYPDDLQRVIDAMRRPINEGEVNVIEYRIICRKGHLHHLNSRSTMIRNSRQHTLIVGTLRDVTDEVNLLSELQQRSIVAELISENNVDMVSAFDTDLRVIGWNKKCEERYKLAKDKVLGNNYTDVFPWLAGSDMEAAMHAALQGKTTHLQQKRYVEDEGHYDSFILPLNSGETTYGVLVISHDLTEMRTTAEKLALLNQQLEQKNGELSKINNELASFTYVASHDLQEPLRKIRTFSERLLERELNSLTDTGKDYLLRMDNATKRMQQLIDDLLVFSRTSTAPKEFAIVDLNNTLADVKENIKHLVDESNATIVSDQLPVANVVAFQVQQLFENLLINSIKYRREAVPPVIRISYALVDGRNLPFIPSSLTQQYHKISFEDNGIGFEQQYADKIFEIFQRLHGKHEYSGTGVGLAIVKKTMETHSGFIEAQGRPGEGATFTVYLPA